MPIAALHKVKFKKNIAVFFLVLGFIALIWAVTMIKIADQAPETESPLSAPEAQVQ